MRPDPITDADRPPEHIFGTIHEITVPLEWAPKPKNARRKARNLTKAMTETWSVNGVGFTSAPNDFAMEAAVLTIAIGPVVGDGVVRTVREIDETSVYYGVELISDDLQNVARDLISIHLRHLPEGQEDDASPLGLVDPNGPPLSDWT